MKATSVAKFFDEMRRYEIHIQLLKLKVALLEFNLELMGLVMT